MNVSDLSVIASKKVYEKTGNTIPRAKLEIAIHAVFDAIREVTIDENVTITDFGTFTKRTVPHKVIKSVFTKNSPNGVVEVPQHIAPLFKASKKYKAALRYGDKVAN
jgi:nucleoid DNA-binding protein